SAALIASTRSPDNQYSKLFRPGSYGGILNRIDREEARVRRMNLAVGERAVIEKLWATRWSVYEALIAEAAIRRSGRAVHISLVATPTTSTPVKSPDYIRPARRVEVWALSRDDRQAWTLLDERTLPYGH